MMKNILIVLCIGILATEAQDNTPSHEVLPSCTGLMMRMAKKQLKLFGECSKELKAQLNNHEEFGDKIQCVVKCVLDKSGMLDENKRATKATMQSFMDQNVPELFHSVSHDLLEHCIEDYGPKMDHTEELCTVYGDFVKCMQDVVANICSVSN